jgi:hypothetical protein
MDENFDPCDDGLVVAVCDDEVVEIQQWNSVTHPQHEATAPSSRVVGGPLSAVTPLTVDRVNQQPPASSASVQKKTKIHWRRKQALKKIIKNRPAAVPAPAPAPAPALQPPVPAPEPVFHPAPSFPSTKREKEERQSEKADLDRRVAEYKKRLNPNPPAQPQPIVMPPKLPKHKLELLPLPPIPENRKSESDPFKCPRSSVPTPRNPDSAPSGLYSAQKRAEINSQEAKRKAETMGTYNKYVKKLKK